MQQKINSFARCASDRQQAYSVLRKLDCYTDYCETIRYTVILTELKPVDSHGHQEAKCTGSRLCSDSSCIGFP